MTELEVDPNTGFTKTLNRMGGMTPRLDEYSQEFVPGPTLSFRVDLTTAIDVGPQPDQFSFAILDCSLVEIPTTSPSNALVSVDLDSSSPTIQTFSGSPSGFLNCTGGLGIALATPVVGVVSDSPALLLVLAGVAALVGATPRFIRPETKGRGVLQ